MINVKLSSDHRAKYHGLFFLSGRKMWRRRRIHQDIVYTMLPIIGRNPFGSFFYVEDETSMMPTCLSVRKRWAFDSASDRYIEKHYGA